MKHLASHMRHHFVAYVALFVALGGSAYAVPQFIRGSGEASLHHVDVPFGTTRHPLFSVDGAWQFIVTRCDPNPDAAGNHITVAIDNTSSTAIYWSSPSDRAVASMLQAGETIEVLNDAGHDFRVSWGPGGHDYGAIVIIDLLGPPDQQLGVCHFHAQALVQP